MDILRGALESLEYRGYDSAGVAVVIPPEAVTGKAPAGKASAGKAPDGQEVSDDKIWIAKSAAGTGSLNELAKKCEQFVLSVGNAPTDIVAGIGHTRWATHGRPIEANAHPLMSCNGEVAIVHNGIIENYFELGAQLQKDGHELTSETDSEVIAHLIESELAKDGSADVGDNGERLHKAVLKTVAALKGSFALAIVWSKAEGTVVAARRISPLIVGITSDLILVASDIPALLGYTRELFALEDDQVVQLRPGFLKLTDIKGAEIEPTPMNVDWDVQAAQRQGWDDFMCKEIHEQPSAVRDTLMGRLLPNGTLTLDETRFSDDELRSIEKVFIVGCGSSFHAGMVAKYVIEHWVRLTKEVDIASELRYRDPIMDSRTLVVGVSQSGETIDTLRALREAKRQKAKVLVVTNVVDSSMAREADGVLYTRAGPEIGVASTKTHLAQITALEILALYLAELRGTLYRQEISQLLKALAKLPLKLEQTLAHEAEVSLVADQFGQANTFFFIGRHVGYPVALEGALKLKEIAYLQAQGYAAGELKHGPIALIEPGVVVVGVATRTLLWEKLMANIAEVRARGASVVLVANQGDTETAERADAVLWVPTTHPLLAPILDIVPLQMLAYFLAIKHGNNVDKPRNLAKTVTVE